MRNGEKAYWRGIKSRYGLDRGGFWLLWAEQRGLCALCETELTEPPSRDTHVDHCHEHGHVRGLLCWYCNTRLGWAEQVGTATIQRYLDDSRQKGDPT